MLDKKQKREPNSVSYLDRVKIVAVLFGLEYVPFVFQDASLRVKGIFVRAVVPDSPAARCGKLAPGDRILAVNGVSLLDLDYQR